jgi:uncharacterized iron-regulated membrane protein
MACITGLPLVFQDELAPLLEPHAAAAVVPTGTPDASLDRMVGEARSHFPNLKPLFVAYDDDEPRIFVTMARSLDPSRTRYRPLSSISIQEKRWV